MKAHLRKTQHRPQGQINNPQRQKKDRDTDKGAVSMKSEKEREEEAFRLAMEELRNQEKRKYEEMVGIAESSEVQDLAEIKKEIQLLQDKLPTYKKNVMFLSLA